MSARRLLTSLLTALLPLLAGAQAVQLGGLAGGKALLIVGSEPPRFIGPGQSVGEAKLLQVLPDGAVVEVGGERLTLRLGQSPLTQATAPARGNGSRVVLEAGHGGHFISAGQINGKHVEFLVDTGATVVAMGRADAERIGIKPEVGRPVQMNTANGVVIGHQVQLASVKLGDATLYDVPAVVMPTPMSHVLLGNSFLSRFQLKRENTTLTLEKRY